MAHPSTAEDNPGPELNGHTEDAVGQTQLAQGVISPKRALFFALSGLALPVILAAQGATMAYSSAWSSWLAMLVGTVIVGTLAIIVARYARRHLATGSLMSYVNLESGERLGSLVGVCLMVGYACMLTVFSANMLVYLVSFVNSISSIEVNNHFAQVVIAAALLAFGYWLVQRGVSVSVNVAVVLGWIGMPFIVYCIIAAVAHRGLDLTPQLQLQDFSLALFLPGVVLAFGIFSGFEGFTALAMETANPRRTIPPILRAVVVCGGLVGVVGILLTLPIMMENLDTLTEGSSPLSILADEGNVAIIGSIADALIFLTSMGSLIVFISAAGRIVGTAAQDGMLPRSLAHIDPKRHTPARATAAICILSIIVLAVFVLVIGRPMFTTFIDLFTMSSYSWLVAYVIVAVVGIMDSVRRRDIGFGAVSVLGLLGTGFIIAYSIAEAEGASAGLVWTVLGTIAVLWCAGLIARRNEHRPDAADQLI
ncbi:APC family permease [Rhodococcus sp. NBC_00297]|uniref:APC family permease n=1 Tax=Rhodococcus sp. NBC_00297 TaxID=2976005 RepID=UPI002E2850AF|nr:APC family permease [Rhodococcus sp. NBC_00297]